MKCGIVGLTNVGKSTLFNCLSNAKARSANFPFCTIEPNIGMVTVPDKRLEKLRKMVNPERVIPATIEIIDVAGLVKGASKGDGLGNQFLGNIRECSAIIHVLRCFENDSITHVDGSIDPIRDKETIDIELQLKDLETLEKRLDKQKKTAKSSNKTELATVDLLERLKKHLQEGKSIRSFECNEKESEFLRDCEFLTNIPILYLCNVDEASAKDGDEWVNKIKTIVRLEEAEAEVIYISVAAEADIAELHTYKERQLSLEDLGLEEPGVNVVIRTAYKLLDLQTYFTVGIKEVRAWTIKKGFTASQAARVIHTDLEKGFIKAEVIKYDDYIKYGSEAALRQVGKLAIEGKDYILQDADILHFRFNV